MRRPDGTPWIHSFAHGRATYELKYDAAAIRKAIERADKEEVIAIFIALIAAANLNDVEITELRDLVMTLTGAGAKSLNSMIQKCTMMGLDFLRLRPHAVEKIFIEIQRLN
jgi:hypothetical protein